MTLGAAILCVVALATTGTADAPASSTDRGSVKIYKMHRPGLRVRLQVQGRVIFPTRVWVLQRCIKSGFEGAAGLSLEEPNQKIPIDHKNRFAFVFPQDFGRRIRLGGHVYERKITGYFLRWEYNGREVCGTGRPGDRVLRFVARAG